MSWIASLFCCGLQGRGTRQSSQQVDTVIKVPDLCVRSPVSHKFHGRLVCLWVRPCQSAQVASSDEPICLPLPLLSACKNISRRITDQWGASISHLGYSSRNNSASSLCSASLNDSPTSIAYSLAVWDLCIQFP